MNKSTDWDFLDEYEQIMTFKQILTDLIKGGEIVSPRGMKVIEFPNYQYTLPPYTRFMNFKCRKLNVDYIKRELLWYLKGDRFDDSILQHAKLWESVINEDGSINSNYGQYIFGEQNQFDRIITTLTEDPDSRRASIIILSNDHFSSKTDVPCTYSMNFRIRDNKLEMTVRMRSQDAIFGMGSDAPIFSIVHEMIYHKLKDTFKKLEYGDYYHSADSFHVYERHFKMLKKITGLSVKNAMYDSVGLAEFNKVLCPKILNSKEVDFIRRCDFSDIPKKFKFSRWLNTFNKK